MGDRLEKQLRFLVEIDKLKGVLRRSFTTGVRRLENPAEHSWHLALMAVVLLDHQRNPRLDLGRVLKMVLIHDLVEIDAGDTFCYDDAGAATKQERERAAADRIFRLLPEDQGAELCLLWDEFENAETDEARFAHGVDRLHPILQNLHTGGASWRQHGIAKAQVLQRNQVIGETMPSVWAEILQQLDRADREGFFTPAAPPLTSFHQPPS